MSRASAQRQTDRREEILNAAQRCFARSGFHGASMQEICAEAQMSPGGLYRYFASKEALITGIAERDRADVAQNFAAVADLPDIFTTLEGLARHYLVERSDEEIGVCAEIRTESRRSPEINRIHQSINTAVETGLVDILKKAVARGEIPDNIDLERAVIVLLALGDGLEWRRATDPTFNIETVFPHIMQIARCLLGGNAEGKEFAS
jgi:TetR/AcrR family transcriptional repressor of uid operon